MNKTQVENISIIESRTVAVIEDDEHAREALVFQLETAGLKVVSHPSAESFLGASGLDNFDCIIADICLPKMNGLQLLGQIKQVLQLLGQIKQVAPFASVIFITAPRRSVDRIIHGGEVETFYRELGLPEASVILLLHGFSTSSHMFRNLIPELASHYRVIAPDLPGFGNTIAPALHACDRNVGECCARFLCATLLEDIVGNQFRNLEKGCLHACHFFSAIFYRFR
jgi:CheY-like chemotaxis protein